MLKQINIKEILIYTGLFVLLGLNLYRFIPERPTPSEFPTGSKVDTAKLGVGVGPAIVLVNASTCRYCTESMPFYKKLWATAKDEGIPIISVATGSDTEEKNTAYFKEHGIALASAPILSKDTPFKALPTPSLFLFYRGEVITFLRGKLKTEQEETAFLTAVLNVKRGASQGD